MPIRRLPRSPDLRHLKLQAKTLLKECLNGDADARARLAAVVSAHEEATLSQAQTALAREYGVRSWPRLLHRVAALNFIYDPEQANATPDSAVLQHIVELLPEHWSGARVLARNGEAAVDALIGGLKHRSPRVRAACASYFDGHRHARGIEALHHHANDPEPKVRRNVIHSLGCERCNGAPLESAHVDVVKHACLNDASSKVRREAAWLLGQQLGDAGAQDILHTMLGRETDPWVRAIVRTGLSNHARALLARKTEAAVRELIGAPQHVAEQTAQGSPRMLYYDVAVLAAPGSSKLLAPVWMRLIIKNGSVGSVTVLEGGELMDLFRKTG